MRDLIISCLSSMDIVYCIDVKEVHSLVDYLRVIFRNSKNEYCKLELFYTDSLIFSRQSSNVGFLSNNFLEDYRDKVVTATTKFKSYADCKTEIKRSVTSKTIDLLVSTYLTNLTDRILEIKLEGLEIINVSTFMKPVSSVVIIYKIDNIVCKPMKKFIGEPNSIYSLDELSRAFEKSVNEVLLINL